MNEIRREDIYPGRVMRYQGTLCAVVESCWSDEAEPPGFSVIQTVAENGKRLSFQSIWSSFDRFVDARNLTPNDTPIIVGSIGKRAWGRDQSSLRTSHAVGGRCYTVDPGLGVPEELAVNGVYDWSKYLTPGANQMLITSRIILWDVFKDIEVAYRCAPWFSRMVLTTVQGEDFKFPHLMVRSIVEKFQVDDGRSPRC